MFGSLTTEAQAAISAAISAAQEIMDVYAMSFSPTLKEDGSPVTQADLRSNARIEAILSETNYPIITEETVAESFEVRQHYDRVWCVDPLDGTKEFIKRNDEFAICIALIEQHQSILGLIASPVQQLICIGSPEFGVYTFHFEQFDHPEKWTKHSAKEVPNQPLVIATSRSHLSGSELQFTNEMKAKYGEVSYVRKGSALKFIDLVTGKCDIYPRFAPTMEWDIAAGQAILEALGGEVLHANSKEALRYNRPNLINPYFIAYTTAVKE